MVTHEIDSVQHARGFVLLRDELIATDGINYDRVTPVTYAEVGS
jgi:hypothetical protein